MTRTPEERITALEISFVSMGEGLARVEKTLEKLDGIVAAIMDKLDTRYPSKESVELRIADLRTEIDGLKNELHKTQVRLEKTRIWQATVSGAIGLGGFALGLISNHIKF